MSSMDKPTCGTGTRAEDYNLPLHVGAIFIIFAVSAGACAFPLIVLKAPQLRISPKFLFFVRHFGTGVLLATCFVHLFPTAFVSLTDPCLPKFFNEDYPAFAGAIALAAVFIITTVEMVFSPGRSLCSENALAASNTQNDVPTVPMASISRSPSVAGCDEITPGTPNRTSSNIIEKQNSHQADNSTAERTPQFGRTRTGRSHKKGSVSMPEGETDASQQAVPRSSEELSFTNTFSDEKSEEQRRKTLTMQCMLLECGILFHSIFIGMALAVAVGSEQVVLLIAIAFHQMFEGLALGSRIAAVGWKKKSFQPWVMAAAYGCTTPLGQAIGISTRNLYSPDSATGLIVVGTMNAISSGLLTYTSLVDLLSEDFLSDDSWRTLRGMRRVTAMSLVFGGAFCMSLIGAWA